MSTHVIIRDKDGKRAYYAGGLRHPEWSPDKFVALNEVAVAMHAMVVCQDKSAEYKIATVEEANESHARDKYRDAKMYVVRMQYKDGMTVHSPRYFKQKNDDWYTGSDWVPEDKQYTPIPREYALAIAKGLNSGVNDPEIMQPRGLTGRFMVTVVTTEEADKEIKRGKK